MDDITSWAAPFSGDKEVEARVVPLAERQVPKYGGFSFAIKTADLSKNFRLVHEEKVLNRISRLISRLRRRR